MKNTLLKKNTNTSFHLVASRLFDISWEKILWIVASYALAKDIIFFVLKNWNFLKQNYIFVSLFLFGLFWFIYAIYLIKNDKELQDILHYIASIESKHSKEEIKTGLLILVRKYRPYNYFLFFKTNFYYNTLKNYFDENFNFNNLENSKRSLIRFSTVIIQYHWSVLGIILVPSAAFIICIRYFILLIIK